MSYKLQFSSNFEKQLKKLHPKDAQKTITEITKLANEPRPGGKKVKRLIGTKALRIRIGKVRVIYFVDQAHKTIYVEDVAYRKDIY